MVSRKAPLLYSTMMEEGDCAINSDSDVGSNEPHQQRYHPIDVPQSGDSSADGDTIGIHYESSL